MELHAGAQEVLAGPNYFRYGAFGRFDRTGPRVGYCSLHIYVVLAMGERSRRWVEEMFSCESLLDNMGKIYIELSDQKAC